MARFFKELAERFKPGIFERLSQSAAAKKKLREEPAPAPQVKTVQVDTTPTGGRIIRAQIDIETTMPTQTSNQSDWDAIRLLQRDMKWRSWHTQTNSITACTSHNDPWNQWFTAGTGSITIHSCADTATTDGIYEAWITNGATANIGNIVHDTRVAHWILENERTRPARRESAAARRRREEEEARYLREQREANDRYRKEEIEREAKRKAAEDRAMELLRFMLTPEQQSDLKNHKHFYVNAPSGRLYRIDQGTHGNLKVVHRETRKIIERLCIQPPGVPAGDAMLMQKLLIETGEAALRKHANITLENGEVIRGDPTPLTGEKLAQIIPLRRAA